MSNTIYYLWCYVEGDSCPFRIPASSTIIVDELKTKIKEVRSNLLRRVDASSLDLWKPHADVDPNDMEDKIYQFDPNDQQKLRVGDKIFEIWPEPPSDRRLHIFVCVPSKAISLGKLTAQDVRIGETYPSDALISYEAAVKLHKAMWGQDLGSRLQEVGQCGGLKYLPATAIEELQLRRLGCTAEAILVREEYPLTLKALKGRQNKSGGIIVTGHPGIGKSVFIFYALLHLLSEGQTVALECDTVFVIFRANGVEMHRVNSLGLFFNREERAWALSDSTESSRHPCRTFQAASKMGSAWIVQATSSAMNRYERLRKECNAGLFVMNCFTREESRALSIIYGLDTEYFLKLYDKWGPSGRTCLGLAWRTMSEKELELKLGMVAKKFAEDPTAMTTEADWEADSHLLFTMIPDSPKRDFPTLRVATRYLHDSVMRTIASIDAAKQVSFYTEATGHPFFRGAFGHVFKKFFYVWLSSIPDNELLCTAAMSTARKRAKQLRLRPVGWERVIVHDGEASDGGYKTANKQQTPFGWVPRSRPDATFDAVICTDKNIITIQVTVAASHSMKAEGFKRLEQHLPKRFQRARSWCHVFVTNHSDAAAKLRKKTYMVADEMKISIYTAVLDLSLFKFSPEVLNHAKAPIVSDNSIGTDVIGMEIDAEGE